MGYYLLDHPNPHGPFFYRTRARKLVGIVVHFTAGLEDLDLQGIDHSAEKTASYAAGTTRAVSWHSGSDTDSVIELLPPGYTAFQCRNYNSSTYGHELSKKDMVWKDESPDWVTATLSRPAAHLGRIAEAAGIPIRRVSKAQLDRAIAAQDPSMGGFIGHRELDPSRRSDPGLDFPWERFLTLIGDTMAWESKDGYTYTDDGDWEPHENGIKFVIDSGIMVGNRDEKTKTAVFMSKRDITRGEFATVIKRLASDVGITDELLD